MNGCDPVIGQAVGVVRIATVLREAARGPVKSVQTAPPRTDPEDALPIFIDLIHIIITEAVRIVGIVLVGEKFLARSIELVEGPPKLQSRAHPSGLHRSAQYVYLC